MSYLQSLIKSKLASLRIGRPYTVVRLCKVGLQCSFHNIYQWDRNRRHNRQILAHGLSPLMNFALTLVEVLKKSHIASQIRLVSGAIKKISNVKCLFLNTQLGSTES